MFRIHLHLLQFPPRCPGAGRTSQREQTELPDVPADGIEMLGIATWTRGHPDKPNVGREASRELRRDTKFRSVSTQVRRQVSVR
jgi:hypothetical protein